MGMGQETFKEESQVQTFTSFLNWGAIRRWVAHFINLHSTAYASMSVSTNKPGDIPVFSKPLRCGRCSRGLRVVRRRV